jgi:hypothetical protein
MLVSEFIEWLKTQDQDATVKCVVVYPSKGYYDQGGNPKEVDFTPERSEYIDWSKYPKIKGDDKELLIGEM